MELPEIERLQKDLSTIREAAGLELPFGWEDVWLEFSTGVLGLVAGVWSLIPHGYPRCWGFVPAIVLIIPYTIWLRVKYRRSSGRSPIRRREHTSGFVVAAVLAGLLIVYRIWARQLQIPFFKMQGIALFMVGVGVVLPSVLDVRRIYLLGYAIPLMLCGLSLPWVGMPAEFMGALVLIVSGPACAIIQIIQLRRAGIHYHAAD